MKLYFYISILLEMKYIEQKTKIPINLFVFVFIFIVNIMLNFSYFVHFKIVQNFYYNNKIIKLN
jgi:hypothetical protein